MALRNTPGRKGHVSGIIIDVDDVESIAKSAEEIGMVYGRLDILVNNAGICPTGRDVVSNLRKALSTNVLGGVAVAEYYKHLLRRSPSPRIVFVSSSLGCISHAADPTSKYYPTKFNEYRISKAATNMAMVQTAKTYAEEGRGLEHLKVFGADPGPNVTNLMGEDGRSRLSENLPTPDIGANVIARVVKGEHDDKAGRVIGAYGVSDW